MRVRETWGARVRLLGLAALAVTILFGSRGASPPDCLPGPEEPVDTDGDGVADDVDVCPAIYDPAQADWDGDGAGDACSPGWRPALHLRNVAFGAPTRPDVAVAGEGTAFVVWGEESGGATRLLVRRYAGGNWGSPTEFGGLVPPATLGDGPYVAADDAGNAVAVWLAEDTAGGRVESSRFDGATATWSTPATLSDPTGDAAAPRVAMGPGGVAVAVWRTPGTTALMADRLVGGVWEGAAPAATPPEAPRDAPAVDVDAAGRAVVVWCQNGTPADTAWVARHDGTGWSAPVGLAPSSTAPDRCSSPAVAVSPSGDARLAFDWWLAGYFPLYTLRTSAYDLANDSWSASEQVGTARNGVGMPDVALNDAGTAQITWIAGDTSYTALSTVRCDGAVCGDGGGFETFVYNDDTTVGMDACGRAVTAWVSESGPPPALPYDTRGSATDDAGAWTTPASILRALVGTDPEPGPPTIDTNAAGRSVAAWRDHTGLWVARHVTGCVP